MINNDFMAEHYLRLAYYIDESKIGEIDNVKLFQRDKKEYPKYSVHGLKVRSSHTAKALSELKVGESYQNYTRVF